MQIAIRADGGPRIGLGHLGRCVALAQAFVSHGQEPVFIDVPHECLAWVRGHGLRCVRFGADRWDIIIADSYRFTGREIAELRRKARTLVVIDDFGTFKGPCDWVLNSHVYARRLRFSSDCRSGLILGPKFHPLRREYWEGPRARTQPARVRRVLVTLGGGENEALTSRLAVIAAKTMPQAIVHAVSCRSIGDGAVAGRIVRHGPQRSLLPLIERCDLAVCAGGQTLYEMAFAGTPVIGVCLGRDQEGNLDGMESCGAVLIAGVPDAPGFERRFAGFLRRVDRRPSLRKRMSKAGRLVLDGRGALRVAALLLERAAA